MGDDLRTHRIETNGIHLHVVESGPPDGPAVLCCHGFPESWYSWRHQLRALGDAGYRVLAPDMRGYGRSAKPADPLAYTQLHHTGDLVGVLDALGIDQAVIVGHDWGGPAAWTAAQLRPDRFRAIAALGVPFLARRRRRPRPSGCGPRSATRGSTSCTSRSRDEPRPSWTPTSRPFLRGFFHSLSGDSPRHPFEALGGGPRPSTVLEHLAQPTSAPSWMTDDDLAFYVGEFERTGFRGGLSWYRSADATFAAMGAFRRRAGASSRRCSSTASWSRCWRCRRARWRRCPTRCPTCARR